MISDKLLKLFNSLEKDIQDSYEQGVTLPEAEKLASKFLGAQMTIANSLRDLDLDSRMRKSGVKAIRAAVYLDHCQKSEKKPSDVWLEHSINTSEVVQSEQLELDTAEVDHDHLQNYLRISVDGHIFFRNIAKNQG